MSDYPSKCHTCGLLARNFLAGFQCLIAGCTNPLAGPEQYTANQKLGRKISDAKYYRKNQKMRYAQAKAWRAAHPKRVKELEVRQTEKRSRARRLLPRQVRPTAISREERNARRRKKYRTDATFRARESARHVEYCQRQLAAGKAFIVCGPDGARRWMELNAESGESNEPTT